MKERDNLIRLFRRYGFEYRSSASNGEYLAFTFKSGFFHNAELVSLESERKREIEEEMEPAYRDLEKLGFSTKKTFYKSFEEVEKSLFDGFFNTEEWKGKIKNEYKAYCRKVLSVLPKEAERYSYIKAPFRKNNNLIEGDIVRDICDSLCDSGPQLIIIEAPAGFGKTCTSYEIINTLASGDGGRPIPFFTEFSRDRQARVFSHIFIREVDRSFSSVNSNVVIEEVKEGRVAVVLDGFDELLHDKSSNIESSASFDNAEPMLETISELLTKNAKVVLTSRRSAIFDGEMFNEWVRRYDDRFSINRYRIERPEVKDWIPVERLQRLEEVGINVEKLSNPIILSFLRFVGDEYFLELCERPSLIVEQYFTSMLEREMDRQELRMNPDEQTELLSLVAGDMCDNDYTSDSREKIISVIKDKGGNLLSNVRSLYSPKDRPTIDKLATTLSNHAFFDRSSQGDNNIEFVNEFVFGNYISEGVVRSKEDWLANDERFVEPAVFSYVARDGNDRELLWEKLEFMRGFLDPSSRMKFESLLMEQVGDEDYNECEISSVHFGAVPFFMESCISGSVFNGCVFKGVFFNFKNFHDVTFLSCDFWDCSFSNEAGLSDEVSFYNCRDNNDMVDKLEELSSNDSEDEVSEKDDVSIYIFSKIWPVGSQSIERIHFFTKTLFNTDEFSRKDIVRGIKKLKKDGFLEDAKDNNFVAINKSKISEIKAMLGRG
ncbi:NACHT domain-containing protein [Halomonas sp. H5]|uniref:NACHT domain-containing protein n=1 Tax=Halomonas sp. H5 TaxID=3423910 RepID=UPI003D369B01